MGNGEEPIRAYGFIDAVTDPPAQASNFARVNFLVDAIRAEAFDNRAVSREPSHLLVLRLMSTIRRLQDRFPDVKWEEGEWVELELQERYCEPPVWFITAEADYEGPVRRTNLVRATPINTKGAPSSSLGSRLAAYCQASQHARRPASSGRKSRAAANVDTHIRVVDVGQASFAAIHTKSNFGSPIIGYFDVGGPAFFHQSTFPSSFAEASRIPAKGFVAISHWDFDHYSLAVSKLTGLQNLSWYAPDQVVGPNAAALQAKLGSKLTLLSVPTFEVAPGLELWKGTGTGSNRNHTGYVMRALRQRGSALLTGDLPYALLPPPVSSAVGALAITHHGGSGSGVPPAPTAQGAIAAVSYGNPNRYHHPDPAVLVAHKNLGWSVRPTYVSAGSRGDVWL